MASRTWIAPALLALALAPAAATAADTPRTGKQVVDEICSGCHAAGVNGAPRLGDREEWIRRARDGIDKLTGSAIRGHRNMPARGGTASLLDTEMRAAVTHMVRSSLEAGAPSSYAKPAPAPR